LKLPMTRKVREKGKGKIEPLVVGGGFGQESRAGILRGGRIEVALAGEGDGESLLGEIYGKRRQKSYVDIGVQSTLRH